MFGYMISDCGKTEKAARGNGAPGAHHENIQKQTGVQHSKVETESGYKLIPEWMQEKEGEE